MADELKPAFLDAPCAFCGYNGDGYWQRETHTRECPWYYVGGRDERARARNVLYRAPVSPSAPAVASEVDVARQLRHSLNDIKFKDTTVRGAPTSQGYEFVEIPVWQIRQWIDRLSRAPAPQEDVEHHSEPSTKGEVK